VQATLRDAVDETMSVGQQTARARRTPSTSSAGRPAVPPAARGAGTATHDDLEAIRAQLRGLAKAHRQARAEEGPAKKKK